MRLDEVLRGEVVFWDSDRIMQSPETRDALLEVASQHSKASRMFDRTKRKSVPVRLKGVAVSEEAFRELEKEFGEVGVVRKL